MEAIMPTFSLSALANGKTQEREREREKSAWWVKCSCEWSLSCIERWLIMMMHGGWSAVVNRPCLCVELWLVMRHSEVQCPLWWWMAVRFRQLIEDTSSLAMRPWFFRLGCCSLLLCDARSRWRVSVLG